MEISRLTCRLQLNGVNLSVKEATEQGRVGDLGMLDCVVEQAREEKIFSREDTPTEQRVEDAFLYHAGLSYRRVERVIGRSYEAVR